MRKVKYSPPGVYVANEPVLVVNSADAGSTFVLTEVVVCANAAPVASAQAAPMAKILANVLSFMFVLCFVKRMMPVVTNFDWLFAGVIQPQERVRKFIPGRTYRIALSRPDFSSLICNH